MNRSDANHEAAEKYPAREVAPQNLLHVYHEGGKWHVWLNVDAEFTGLCLAVEVDYDKAMGEAVATLEAAVAALQGPRWFPEPEAGQ